MGVGGFDAIKPGEGRDQHEQGRARQVEIGQQQIDRAETVARQNEEPGFARERADFAGFGGGGFEEAQAGRACCHDAAAGASCGVDPRRGLGRQFAPLGVHAMLARVVGLDRQKGTGTDMQGQGRETDAAAGQPLGQRRREMQTGSRSRDRPFGAGKHRLIIGVIALVAGWTLDVGRQRHRTITREPGAKRPPLRTETQGDVALGVFCHDRGGEIRGEVETVAGPQPACTLGKGAPHAAALIVVQRHLDRCRAALPDQPGRNDFSVVADQQIAWPQQIRQIGNTPVGEWPRGRYVQQARGFAGLAWVLGDQSRRSGKSKSSRLSRGIASDKSRSRWASIHPKPQDK